MNKDYQSRLEQMKKELDERRQMLNSGIHQRQQQFRDEMERRRRVLLGQADSDVPQEPQVVPLTTEQQTNSIITEQQESPEPSYLKLKHYDGLEEDSKTKIGNFERLCATTYHIEPGRKDYNDIDSAPLINLLTGIIEIELNAALYQWAKRGEPDFGEKNKDHATLGQWFVKLQQVRRRLASSFTNIDATIDFLEAIKDMRNDVSHGEVIKINDFYRFFYRNFIPFYKESIPDLIRIKRGWSNDAFKNLSGDNKIIKEENSIDNFDFLKKFTPEDNEYLQSINGIFDEEQELLSSRESTSKRHADGIIFTDTSVLSSKYGVGRGKVLEILNDFISVNRQYRIKWFLLDVVEWQSDLGERTWMDYSDVLQEFMVKKGIAPSPKLSLFIVGGNDVIPQPAERNLCARPGEEDEDIVYADFFYCFYGKLPKDFLDYNKARCNVARLPLEMGQMKTTIEEDLSNYFLASNRAMACGGIKIGNATMTTNVDWIPASREMSHNLPIPHIEDVDGETMDGMYLSPGVTENMGDDLRNRYYQSLKAADMLVFNLHGSRDPKRSGFYSSELAFSIEMLSKSSAPVFNTTACWGARYVNYRREDSMLLNALYNSNVLLYTGASVAAIGKCGNYQYDSSWRIRPAAYSESLLCRFAEYQCIGILPAGEAFLKAKCDYYNTSRAVENDEWSLGTLLMFNLYGNPQLRTKPDNIAISALQNEDGSKKADRDTLKLPYRKMQRKVVMNQEQSHGLSAKMMGQKESLMDKVRGLVNSNLYSIHQTMAENLYAQMGLSPRELLCVEEYSTQDTCGITVRGFLYNYRRELGGTSYSVCVMVDNCGKIIDAIEKK